MLLHSIRSSIRGAARNLLKPLGEDSSEAEVLDKLDSFYRNVSSAETIIQSFYSDYQKESESVATFGSRLEQTLSRVIRYGHMELIAKDSMLRSKFWTGLRSQQLRNSTRYLYDTLKDFPSLLEKICKVEQKDSCSQRPVQPTVPSKTEGGTTTCKLKSEMRSFKSNENIHKKEGGSFYVVSANKASSVTL